MKTRKTPTSHTYRITCRAKGVDERHTTKTSIRRWGVSDVQALSDAIFPGRGAQVVAGTATFYLDTATWQVEIDGERVTCAAAHN